MLSYYSNFHPASVMERSRDSRNPYFTIATAEIRLPGLI
jgi:hypothetical protein